MFAVVVRTGVVVVVLERHVLCAFGGQVSEARVECTFLANDAAYLTLSRAVTQLRRSEIVTPGVGLTVCVVCGVSNGKVGFGRAFSLHSQSECITSGNSDLSMRSCIPSAIFASTVVLSTYLLTPLPP